MLVRQLACVCKISSGYWDVWHVFLPVAKGSRTKIQIQHHKPGFVLFFPKQALPPEIGTQTNANHTLGRAVAVQDTWVCAVFCCIKPSTGEHENNQDHDDSQ